MFVLNVLIFMLFASEGWSTVKEETLDGVERTREVNIEIITDFILTSLKQKPEKNIVVSALLFNYSVGALAVYARCSCDTQKIIDQLNYTSADQLEKTIPVLTREFQSFENTISAWTGTFYADVSMVFRRMFIDVLYGYFNNNVRNTDFQNPELAASVINQMANVNTIGFSTSGNFISPDMIADDGRFFSLVTNYFEGSFSSYISPCDTQNRTFYTPSGDVIEIPTMRILGQNGYGIFEKYNAELFQLEFVGNAFFMRIVMPKCNDDIPDILYELKNPSRYDAIFSSMKLRQLEIYMPKIEIHKNFDFLSLYEQYDNDVNIRSLLYEGIFENSPNAYVSQILCDIHMRINEGRNYAISGWMLSEEIQDGLERTRELNIKMATDFVRITNSKNPGNNIVLSALLLNYYLGTFAVYAKYPNDTEALINALNFKSLTQLELTQPVLTKEFQSYVDTISVWSGTIYADVSKVFTRNFIDVFFCTFNNNVRNTDLGDSKLAAIVINEVGKVNTLGFSSNGNLISPDSIANDGRFIIIVTNVFEGTFSGAVSSCGTKYRNFYSHFDKKMEVPTMRVQGLHSYGKVKYLDAKILQLNFTGNRYNMRIVIPDSYKDVPMILSKLRNVRTYDEIFSNLELQEIEVYFPVLNIHKNSDVKSLYEMEPNSIDLESLKFNGIFEDCDDAYVSEILAVINLRINEGESKDPDPYHRSKGMKTIEVDKPFIYYICSESGIPMFAGIYIGDK